jgi:hypothetical protein
MDVKAHRAFVSIVNQACFNVETLLRGEVRQVVSNTENGARPGVGSRAPFRHASA